MQRFKSFQVGINPELPRPYAYVRTDSNLPAAVDHYHSLVPLNTNNQRNTTLFKHTSWVYKVQSAKDGRYYALRRLEGEMHIMLSHPRR